MGQMIRQTEGVMPHPGVGKSSETAVYRIFDEHGTLLYVGMGNNPMNRWSSHAAQHPWWSRAATFRVEWYATRREAAAIERKAITDEAPECNVWGRPGSGAHNYARYMEKLAANREAQRRKARPPSRA